MSNELINHFVKAIASDPKFSEAHFQLALLYKKLGQIKNAEIHFKKAINLDEKKIIKIQEKAESLIKKFQFQNAKSQFIKAQKKKDNCAEINLYLAEFYNQQQKISKAIACLESSIKLNVNYSKAYRELGVLLYNQKQYDQARFQIEKALDIDYSDSKAHYTLALLMKQTKDYFDAEQHFLSALDINPKYVDSMIQLAYINLDQNKKELAQKYYLEAKAIRPEISEPELEKQISEI